MIQCRKFRKKGKSRRRTKKRKKRGNKRKRSRREKKNLEGWDDEVTGMNVNCQLLEKNSMDIFIQNLVT